MSEEMNQKSLEALVEKKEGKLVAVASSETEDRLGDVLKTDGWDLKNFKKNPVLLFAHRYSEPPVGIAKNLRIDGKNLVFEPVFHNFTQLAREVKIMYESEPPVMRAFSVGFIAKKVNKDNPHLIEDMELLEISAVPVPAHQSALLVSAKGFTDEEKKEVEGWVKKEVGCSECSDILKEYDIQFEDSEFVSDIKPYPNEHACRLTDPGKYDRFARKNCFFKHAGKCIDVIFGIKAGKSEIQAMRYPKDVWTADAARSHCKSKGGSFEAASKDVEKIDELKELKEEVARLKTGRVLSERNRKVISDAVSAMKSAISILRDLLRATEPPVEEEGKSKGRREVAQEPIVNKVIVRALQKIAGEASETLSKIKKNE